MTILKEVSLGDPAFEYLSDRFIQDLGFDPHDMWTGFELGEDSWFINGTMVEEYYVTGYSILGNSETKKVDELYYITTIDVIDDYASLADLDVPMPKPEKPQRCNCDIIVLMNRGCQCGGV